MKRYLIQHQQVHSNHTRWADTLHEAKTAADGIWDAACVGVRQEISDGDTGERWIRWDGRPDWMQAPALRRTS